MNLDRLEKAGWGKTLKEDGSVIYTRPKESATVEKAKPPEVTYRVDGNGTRWAKLPEAPAEVSVPTRLNGAEADKYAREKLDLQKRYAAGRDSLK